MQHPIIDTLEMEANDSESDVETELHGVDDDVSSKVDTALATCSRKLANLDNLLSHLSEENNNHRIGAKGFDNADISEELIERAFTFDLVHSFIKFELREIVILFGFLEEHVINTLRKMSSFECSIESSSMMQRLHNSKVSLEHSKDRALEMNALLAELQMISISHGTHGWNHGLVLKTGHEGVLTVLEKSLVQEMELEQNTKELEHTEYDLEETVRPVEQVEDLREKVRDVEANMKTTESRLVAAKALSQKQLVEREREMDALREEKYEAETRANRAEERASQLTDSNMELSEEVDFLKSTNESNAKKASLLEKQLRELDIQLQHSRALSEASQEQQNLLYTAIWDMETLIEELKQKVAKAEGRAESAEGRCVILSRTNFDIGKELEFIRSRVKVLENAGGQAALEKKSFAKDIGIGSARIMEMALQLAVERERVRKKLISCTMENKLLREKLTLFQKNASTIESADPPPLSPKSFQVKAVQLSSEFLEMEKLDDRKDSEATTSHLTNDCSDFISTERMNENGNHKRICVYVVLVLAVLLSGLASHIF